MDEQILILTLILISILGLGLILLFISLHLNQIRPFKKMKTKERNQYYNNLDK